MGALTMGQINIRGKNPKKKNITTIIAMVFAIGLLSIGCNTAQVEESSVRRIDTSDTSHVITVTPHTGDTAESLATEYGGEILAFVENELALISIEANDSNDLSSQLLTQLDFDGGSVEESKDAFLAGGEIATMSGGTSGVWAGGGTSGVWAGGSFSWMPENTEIWQQIKLQDGHEESELLGLGVIVAVIDTGVDYEHPALSEAVLTGWDFVDDDETPMDEGTLGEDAGTGHGTNVAGIVRQVAPRASILPIRVLDKDGSGSVANVATAILWAEEQGAQVINLSLGTESDSPAVTAAVDYVSSKGVFVTASTGNTGDENVTHPAKYMDSNPMQVSVTSVNLEDIKSEFATFSPVIEMSAPGENVFGPAPGDMMASWSGTSMAAPMVAGSIALLLGVRPGTDSEYMFHLTNESDLDIYEEGKNQAFNGLIGQGRLHVRDFLRAAK